MSTATLPRFERVELSGDVDLRILSTRKLKTLLIKLYTTADLDATVTERALIPLVLRRGTRRLPDMQRISRHLESLYGALLWSSVSKVGEWHVTKHQLEVVNGRFVPERIDLLREGLRTLWDFFADPYLEDGIFSNAFVTQEKETLRRTIESLIDEKSVYASFRCVEEMCRDEPYRFGENGDVASLEAIGARSLFDRYRATVASAPLTIYVAGDISAEDARAAVEAELALSRETAPAPLRPIPSPVPVGDVRFVEETLDVQQAKLVLGFRHGVTYRDEDYEALLMMNGILGPFSHSKLFQNVREKASLAYSASSWVERTKGLLFVTCGIDGAKFEQARDICLAQIRAMAKGDVSDAEIDATRKTILNHNRMLEDDFANLSAVDFTWVLHGRELDLAGFRERMLSVTKDDIVRVARRLQHDTTYFLHG